MWVIQRSGNAKTDQINNCSDWMCSLSSALPSQTSAFYGQVIAISFLSHKKSYWINQIFIVITNGPEPSLEGSGHSWFPIFHKTTAFQGLFSLEPKHGANLKCSDGQNPYPWGTASLCLEAFQWTAMYALSPFCIALTVALLTEVPPNCSDNKT